VACARTDISASDPLASGTVEALPATVAESPSRWTPSLIDDAREEANRCARARALEKPGDERAWIRLQVRCPLMARARHWRTRVALGTRSIALWQVSAEDGCGRLVGSALVALTLDEGIRYDDVRLPSRVAAAAADWRGRIAAGHEAFIDARLTRESAVRAGQAHSAPARSPKVFQPGLFEGRAERAHQAVATAARIAEQEDLDRIALTERARVISFPPPRLVLVLTP
jgi:hypothetical protein